MVLGSFAPAIVKSMVSFENAEDEAETGKELATRQKFLWMLMAMGGGWCIIAQTAVNFVIKEDIEADLEKFVSAAKKWGDADRESREGHGSSSDEEVDLGDSGLDKCARIGLSV